MTDQEVFDKVARHLLTQAEKAYVVDEDDPRDEACVYRTPTGLKCAIGCLIPDEDYSPKMERGAPAKYHTDEHSKLLRAALEKNGAYGNPDLLTSLQLVHDHNFPVNWERQLRVVARDFLLSAAVIDTLSTKETP